MANRHRRLLRRQRKSQQKSNRELLSEVADGAEAEVEAALYVVVEKASSRTTDSQLVLMCRHRATHQSSLYQQDRARCACRSKLNLSLAIASIQRLLQSKHLSSMLISSQRSACLEPSRRDRLAFLHPLICLPQLRQPSQPLLQLQPTALQRSQHLNRKITRNRTTETKLES